MATSVSVPAAHRFTKGGEEFDLIVAFNATEVGTGTGPVRLSALPSITLNNISAINLVESNVRGVPVTSSRADYPFYIWHMKGLPDPGTIGTNNAMIDGIVTLFVGTDNHSVYVDRAIGSWQSPQTIRKIELTVQYPDGTAVISDDLTDVTFVFRCYRDHVNRVRQGDVRQRLG